MPNKAPSTKPLPTYPTTSVKTSETGCGGWRKISSTNPSCLPIANSAITSTMSTCRQAATALARRRFRMVRRFMSTGRDCIRPQNRPAILLRKSGSAVRRIPRDLKTYRSGARQGLRQVTPCSIRTAADSRQHRSGHNDGLLQRAGC